MNNAPVQTALIMLKSVSYITKESNTIYIVYQNYLLKHKVRFMKYYSLRYSCRWFRSPKTKCTSFHDIHIIFIVYIVPWMGQVLIGLKCLVARIISPDFTRIVFVMFVCWEGTWYLNAHPFVFHPHIMSPLPNKPVAFYIQLQKWPLCWYFITNIIVASI